MQFSPVIKKHIEMLFPATPAPDMPAINYASTVPAALSRPAAGMAASIIPSPVGPAQFELRGGVEVANGLSYMLGIGYEIPLSVGTQIAALRLDGDLWGGGGDGLFACGLLGPSSSYFGAGLGYTSRIGSGSGPRGVALKLMAGGKLVSMAGYEFEAIAGSHGFLIAALATVHI
jgi:hypothetical protein